MSDAPAVPPGPPDVTLLFGPLLIGVLLNTMLYGVMVVQAFMYYHRYKRDRTWFRYLVLYLVIMETANWVCDVGLIYEPLIIRYGTPEALITSPLLLRTDAVLTVLISTPAQLFIAWRVRVVTQSRILPAIISLFAFVSLGGGISVTTIVTLHPRFASFSSFHPEVITWLVASAACDVFLTASLVYSLWIRKTSIISTDSYLNKLIRLTVQTGFITAAAALLDMILYVTTTNTSNFIFDFALSKLYTNSLISTLNARPWREEATQHDAPNVLFEQTPVGRTSFNLVQRRTGYYSQTPAGTNSYTDPRPPTPTKVAVTLDVEQA
ncbi:hypothetical protein DFH07DRAFT_968670 [Mycena maculata]|uniref:DUF6534 domain-containing protein n=1 Tax=Mycena maculata TaxID=230809 RepID=A0AAD7MT85_9AGAR|nr:hypothetical protein DFH07DRAFT_968670 [Mycena maculata]